MAIWGAVSQTEPRLLRNFPEITWQELENNERNSKSSQICNGTKMITYVLEKKWKEEFIKCLLVPVKKRDIFSSYYMKRNEGMAKRHASAYFLCWPPQVPLSQTLAGFQSDTS